MAVNKNPNKNIAGLTPCPGGWMVLPARLSGISVASEEAFVLRKLFEVLDFRPTFEAAAINVPMGWFETPSGQYRPCDHEARQYVGWPRVAGISGTPSRAAVRSSNGEAQSMEPWMTKHDLRRMRWLREAERELQPYHSRSFFSANPDVSFTVMNSDDPLKTSPYHEDGRLERLELIRQRLPGVDDVLTRTPPDGAGSVHMLQAGALLFTARRASGRAISRMPVDPFWDETGMRMEIVR